MSKKGVNNGRKNKNIIIILLKDTGINYSESYR